MTKPPRLLDLGQGAAFGQGEHLPSASPFAQATGREVTRDDQLCGPSESVSCGQCCLY